MTAITPNDSSDVTVSVLTGNLSNAFYGCEVVFTNAAGEFKLRTHIRFAGTISSVNLPIRELSYGTAQLIVGDLWTVYREVRLHDKLVTATATFDPDGLTYAAASDPGLHPNPIACSGGHYAAFVDGYLTQLAPATFATVQMTGSTSYAVDPANTGGVTHLWVLPIGVAFQSGSVNTDADPVLEANVGKWLIAHTVTDADSGKVTRQYPTIQVSDGTNQPYDVTIDSGLQMDEQYGWRYTVRLFQNATLADIPDGALCVLWANERINSAWQAFRNDEAGRQMILAVGYAHADSNTGSAAINTVTFDIVSPLQRLDEIAGYSKVMEESATPDAWSKLASLSTTRAMTQLPYYYTTLVEAGFDWLFDSDLRDYLYPALYLQRSTPIQQVRELAHGVDGRVTCDRTGRFNVYPHPAYIPLADRAAVTVTFTLGVDDIIDFQFTRDHYPKVEMMKTAGFAAGTSPAPIFSLYPGSAPGEAVDAPTRERLICSPSNGQGDLNERTGRYGAAADNSFINADGYWQRAFELHLTLFGSYDFFDLYKEYVTFTLDGSSNLRGVDISSFRFWLKAVQVSYEGGTARTALVLQSETNAPAGTTYLPPQSVVPPVYVPPPKGLPPLPALPARLNNLAAINTDGYVYLTYNLLDASPTWTRAAIPGLTGSITDSVQSAFVLTRQIVTTDAAAGVYTADGIGGTMTTTLRKTLRAGIGGGELRIVDASFGTDFIVVKSYYADGTWVCVSLDGGVTWGAEMQVNAFTGGSQPAGLFVSSRFPGTAVINAFSAPNAGALFNLSGAFGTVTNPGIAAAPYPSSVTKAWADNEQTMYYGSLSVTPTVYSIFRKIGSGTPVDVTPVILGNTATTPGGRALHVAPTDANTLLAAVTNALVSAYSVVMSRDQGATWTTLQSGGSLVYLGAEVSGDSRSWGYCWGVAAIATVDLAGGTVTDRSGNLSSFSPGAFVRIRGI